MDTKSGWYPATMSMEERNLVRKIDALVLGYCCLAFFTKYLDVSALTNAYVSGMKEDLNLDGNRLNYINAGMKLFLKKKLLKHVFNVFLFFLYSLPGWILCLSDSLKHSHHPSSFPVLPSYC